MAFYALEDIPAVDAFVHASRDAERERLLVRHADEGTLELTLELPAAVLEEGARLGLDAVCQIVEGVSHFVLVAERARRELPTTQLELELQAEIDKYVVLALAGGVDRSPPQRAELHARLFAGRFLDPPDTEKGERYRLAHRLAMRFTHQLERMFVRRGRQLELREALRHFYRAGPATKISLAQRGLGPQLRAA